MGFMEIVLGAYGIQKPDPKAAGALKDDEDVACSGAQDTPQCRDKLHKQMSSGGVMDRTNGDSQRWVDLHEEIMRRTQRDKSVSRCKALWALYMALPTFVKIMMSILLIVGAVIGVIPALMITIEVLGDKVALFKCITLAVFTIVVLVGYYLLPIS